MSWNKTVIPTSGNDLLQESLVGHILNVTYATGGAGNMTDDELNAANEVSEQKQVFEIISVDDVDGGKQVGVKITNKGITESYKLRQVAIYAAMDGDETSHLITITQDAHGVEVPAEAENPNFLFELYIVIAISHTAQIKVTVENVASVSADYVNRRIEHETEKHDTNPYAHDDIRKSLTQFARKDSVYTSAQTDAAIKTETDNHNGDVSAHPSIQVVMTDMDARLTTLELKMGTDVNGIAWQATFANLKGLVVAGVWNETYARIEF